jgi:hypothetical protein
MIGRDSAGRIVMQLVLDEADANRLMAFGVDAAEDESGRDDRLYGQASVSVCWLESAGPQDGVRS